MLSYIHYLYLFNHKTYNPIHENMYLNKRKLTSYFNILKSCIKVHDNRFFILQILLNKHVLS